MGKKRRTCIYDLHGVAIVALFYGTRRRAKNRRRAPRVKRKHSSRLVRERRQNRADENIHRVREWRLSLHFNKQGTRAKNINGHNVGTLEEYKNECKLHYRRHTVHVSRGSRDSNDPFARGPCHGPLRSYGAAGIKWKLYS